MADVRDYMTAAGDTDAAISNARGYGGAIEDGRTSDPALATLLAGEAVALAIREVGTRLDYVLRDLERNRR